MRIFLATLSVLGSISISSAQEINFQIDSNTQLKRWVTDKIVTDNSGENVEKYLGNDGDIILCGISHASHFRLNSPNRGYLACRIELRDDNWYLIASGPTHNSGSGASANVECAAMCLGFR